MPARLRLPHRAAWLVPSLVLCIVVSLSHGQGKPGAGAKDAKPGQPDVEADIDAAIKLLDAGEYVAFLEKYAPVEVLREVRKQDAFDAFSQALESQAEVRARLLSTLRHMKKAEPKYDKSRGLATFQFDPSEGEPMPAAEAPKEPAVKAVPGYGNDLPKVLAAAQKTLEAKDYEEFVEKMFPPAATARLGDAGMIALVATLTDDATMAAQMSADLKALAALKPEMADGGKTAVFKFTPKPIAKKDAGKRPARKKDTEEDDEPKERTVKFSLIGDDWRFYDDTQRVAKHLADFAKRKARGSTVTIQMERIGGNWRLLTFEL